MTAQPEAQVQTEAPPANANDSTSAPASPTPPKAVFELVGEETMNFGRNGYLEVARKRLSEGSTTSEFLLVTRGYYTEEGSKRWTKFVTLPDEAPLKEWLAKALVKV